MAAKNQKGVDSVPLDPSLLDWAEYWYPISWKGVLFGGLITAVGACATIAFLLLQWRTTSIREEQSELRTSSLETQTAQANAALGIAQADIAKAHARMAEADARTKEAELKLEQLRRQVAPRILKRDVLIMALERQPKAPTEIMYLRDDAESMQLAQQIALAMEAAGWQITSRLPIPPSSDPQLLTAMTVGGQPSGVTVVVSGITQEEADATLNRVLGKEWVKTPLTVLTHALGESLGGISGHAGGSSAPPPGTLRVVVSPRS